MPERVAVLVVDDEPKILTQIQLLLDGPVMTAQTVEEAHELLSSHPEIGVILCDEYLATGSTGSGLLAELGTWNRQFVFLLFTGGLITEELVQNAINEIRVFKFIKKPVDAQSLRHDVRAAKLEFTKVSTEQ